MLRQLISISAVVGLLLISATSCNKESGEMNEFAYVWFEVAGKVTDAAGAPLEGITVSAEAVESVTTDSAGMFSISGGCAPAESVALKFSGDDSDGNHYMPKTVMVEIEKYKEGHGWNQGYYRNRSEVVVSMTGESVITPPSFDVEK